MENVPSNDQIKAINIRKTTSSALYVNSFMDCISTLPINLLFRRSSEAEGRYGIWSLREIPKNTIFGPYEGLYVDESECHETSGFQWKIKGKRNDVMNLDGSEKKVSNWLRFVNYAQSESGQNLVTIQIQSRIYYITSKIIPFNTELLVWYDISSEEVKPLGKKEYDKENLLKLGKCCLIKNQIENVGSNNEINNTKIPLDAEIEKNNRITIQGSSFLYKAYKKTTELEEKITEKSQKITGNHDHCRNDQKKHRKLRKCLKDEKKIIGKETLRCGLRLRNKGHTTGEVSECVICENKFIQKGNLVKHKKIHDNESCYESNLSRRNFPNISSVEGQEQIHSKKKECECHQCRKKFSYNYQLLIKHKRIHTDQNPFQCNIFKKFKHSCNISTHQKIHNGEKPFQCNTCNKKFRQSQHLNIHKRIHTGEKPFQCNTCNKKFRQSQHLNIHKRIHTGEKPFECNICNKKFGHSGNISDHKRIHTGEKPFQCKICNKKFRYSRNESAHQKIHTGEKSFQCNICNKKFRQSQHLNAHKRIHTGEKPFECNICNKRFGYSHNLSAHRRTHTGEKPFECDICKKKFTHSQSLSVHKRIHTDEKPFQCKICNKKFRESRNLSVHKRIHTGEKPFECNICNKRFGYSHNLSAHRRTHTGEKPFECNICKKKFTWQQSLSVHKRVHTGEMPFECVLCKIKFKHMSSLKWHTRIHT